MLQRFLLALSLFLFLTACGPATETLMPILVRITDTSTPTANPLPTQTILPPTIEMASPTLPEASPTPEAIPDPIPTETLLPIPTLNLPPTQAATAVPKPAADSGVIQFLSPGPLSRIVSPFIVYGYAVPGHNNQGSLELYGENGHLLASKVVPLYNPFKWANFYWELSFDISYVGELGRLTLTTQDDYGRVNAVNSIHLLLLKEGTSIINKPGNLKEACVLSQPVAGQSFSGGVLTVAGKMRPFNNLPLTVELVARDGNILGTQPVAIATSPNSDEVPFRVDMHYMVSKSEYALLTVRQNDDRIGGIMYLYSLEIYLNP
jgi:hypothetical protein